MSEPIDPPAASTASAAKARYSQLCLRLAQQQSLRAAYADAYTVEIEVINAVKAKLQAEKTG